MNQIGSEAQLPLSPIGAEQPLPPRRSALRKVGTFASAAVVGLTANLVTGYSLDVAVTSLLDPNDDPSISEFSSQVPYRDCSAIVIKQHGTGFNTAVYSASVTEETIEALDACVAPLDFGKTFRPLLNGRAIGKFVRSLDRNDKVPIVIESVSGGGQGTVEEIKELQENYGDVLTVAGVVLEAVPDDSTDAKKDLGRFFITHYDLPYGKAAVFLHNLQGQIDEHADFSQKVVWDDLFTNTGKTRVALTQSMLKTINDGFIGVEDPEMLRNSDGSMPEFQYLCVSTDDTVNCETARTKIEKKLKVPVPMNMIQTDVPYMHDRKWIHTVYPLVYERDYIALLNKIKSHTPSWYKHG